MRISVPSPDGLRQAAGKVRQTPNPPDHEAPIKEKHHRYQEFYPQHQHPPAPDQRTINAINMTGDQLHTVLVRISALVHGGLNLVAGIADDDVVHAEELLNID